MFCYPVSWISHLPSCLLPRIRKGLFSFEARQHNQVERRYECAFLPHGASHVRSTRTAENHHDFSSLPLQRYLPEPRPQRDATGSSIQKSRLSGTPVRSCTPIRRDPLPFAMRVDPCSFAQACETLSALGLELTRLQAHEIDWLPPSSNCLLPTAYCVLRTAYRLLPTLKLVPHADALPRTRLCRLGPTDKRPESCQAQAAGPP